ncbi:Pre-rRNA-processing protein ESF1 [Cyberlindnera fabianii]|uniref:Pre-rRNA-processing protein ESF1 n=1 Tax=Cyberlindnera fabianii TaxID=36022 RepID=A0A1V2L242_CYBFA|nr:Pre-rRNA-processing protein ESF1 [Cyberlindnera fabianii]
MAKGDKKASKPTNSKAITKDDRFKAVHSDPRFRLPSKKDFKVKVDDRFSKSDMVMNKSKARVDKYGRKAKDESEVEDEDSEIELEESKPEQGEPSRRFAVVNMDWDHVKSHDLFATFQSFVPTSGLIESVSIYPSQFGKERMQREEVEGPPRDLFKKKQVSDDEDSDRELDIKDIIEEGDGKEDYDSKSLRRYQLQRLRYYYAVVTCDSVETSKAIYDNVDGTEYESTANFFDLRFIPDEMDFDDDEPRDTCTKIPTNYKPETFVTDALQHSKVKLTWDETPADRVKLSSKSFSQRELDDMDFKAYLASDNSDSEEEGTEDLKNKYKNLVKSSTKIGNKDIFATGGDDDDDETGVEITFTPEAAGGNTEERAEGEDESTIDKLKRKAKERRKARKEKLKEMKKQAIEEKKTGKKDAKKGKGANIDEQSKAELELITMDDDDKGHFTLKELVRSEKEKGKKSKHRDNNKIIEDDFKVDLDDSRFKEVFTEHDFAIDPSQPEFQKTSGMKKIIEERNKRRDQKRDDKKNDKQKKRKHDDVTPSAGEDVKSLAQKIKRKSKGGKK